ncbi:nitroreductase family protein [Christensenellaceae bacterium OttesenSCG-928-K19]|nr:nitroreductase family protein [Christensenellaceae bacterium OttesenSCG-928-K19]
MESQFAQVIKNRRSFYDYTKKSPITDDQIKRLLEFALKHTPTAHNTQLTRIVLLLGGEHDKFWDMVIDAILERNPGKEMHSSKEKIAKFRNAYGTALFFNDQKTLRDVIEEMPLYREEHEKWAEHGNAMLQFAVWNMLEEAGFGASLQHYNPIVDERVYNGFGIDRDWRLIAQIPFGITVDEAWDKTFIPMEKRFLVMPGTNTNV